MLVVKLDNLEKKEVFSKAFEIQLIFEKTQALIVRDISLQYYYKGSYHEEVTFLETKNLMGLISSNQENYNKKE